MMQQVFLMDRKQQREFKAAEPYFRIRKPLAAQMETLLPGDRWVPQCFLIAGQCTRVLCCHLACWLGKNPLDTCDPCELVDVVHGH